MSILAIVIVTIVIVILICVACSYRRRDLQTTYTLHQPFAVYSPAEMRLVLPTRNNTVYSIALSIRATDALQGAPLISQPNVASLQPIVVDTVLTHDATWSPTILPKQVQISRGNSTYLVQQRDGALYIRILPSEQIYLTGLVTITLSAIFPRPQDFTQVRLTPAYNTSI